mmetsp:Transcript_278/g.614  ORF Transcript_278/g.614 Transcript_278/m.614 type:complete len:90 (-) Transcript_278:38-307(-)
MPSVYCCLCAVQMEKLTPPRHLFLNGKLRTRRLLQLHQVALAIDPFDVLTPPSLGPVDFMNKKESARVKPLPEQVVGTWLTPTKFLIHT